MKWKGEAAERKMQTFGVYKINLKNTEKQ